MSNWFNLLVLALLAFGAVLLITRRRAGDGDERGLPPELIGAELAYAEQTLRSTRSSVVARLDRAYRTADGLVLVELKTRTQDRVFATDVIELSVQRVALHDATGESVSLKAWVLVDRMGKRKALPVTLLQTGEVAALRERHAALLQGKAMRASPARSLKQCANCGHRAHCAEKFRDRG